MHMKLYIHIYIYNLATLLLHVALKHRIIQYSLYLSILTGTGLRWKGLTRLESTPTIITRLRNYTKERKRDMRDLAVPYPHFRGILNIKDPSYKDPCESFRK